MLVRFPLGTAIVLSLILLPARAAGHQNPYSYVDVHLYADSLTGTASAHIEDLAAAIGVGTPFELLVPATLETKATALRETLAARLDLRADGQKLSPSIGRYEATIERSLITFHFHARWSEIPALITLGGPLFAEDPQHQTYVNFYLASDLRHQDVLTARDREVEYARDVRPSVLSVIQTFVYEGIHHIFIGPDHILFIIGLLLLGGGMKRLLKIVTAFTIAHSITLVLATLQLLNPSPRVIEPAIALSIVYVGVENLLSVGRRRDWRAPIAFCFGFVHGFGFASVLRDFGLPGHAIAVALVAFNIGVEIGQAVIVLAVAPLLAFVTTRRPKLTKPIVAIGSACVILAGGYWFVERIWGA